MRKKSTIRVGDRFLTTNCGWCTVVDYKLYSQITVMFEGDFPCPVVTTGNNLKLGHVNNPQQPSKQNELADVHSTFYYDESSPSCLRWVDNRYSGSTYSIVQCAAGTAVGTLHRNKKESSNGYWNTMHNMRRALCHRIVWEMHFGEIPKGTFIDHMDGDSSNNRISNLRVVTREENARNAKQKSNNSSGVTGVKLQENTDRKGVPYFYYVAFWNKHDRSEGHKCFALSKYGKDEAFRLACNYRAKMIEELNLQGAGYTERHGT